MSARGRWLRFAAIVFLAAIRSASFAADQPAPAEERWSLSDLLPRSLQRNPRVDLTVITEVTRAGRALVPPTAEAPVYYWSLDGGKSEEGNVIAGERPPKSARLAEILEAALAVNHYLRAKPEQPAALVLHYRWGSFNLLVDPDLNEPSPLLITPREEREHQLLRASLIGGDKFAFDFLQALKANTLDQFRARDRRTDWLVDQVFRSNLYFVIASAYSVTGAIDGKRELLWRTKMSTDSRGLTMSDSVPLLVTTAGPYFGRETPEPVILQPRLREGKVEIGTATVQEYLTTQPPPSPSTPAAEKAP